VYKLFKVYIRSLSKNAQASEMNTTTTTLITAITEEAPHLRMLITLDQCIKYRKLQSFAPANKAVSSNPRSAAGRAKDLIRGTKRCRENKTDEYVLAPSLQLDTYQSRRKKSKTSPQHKAQAQKRQNRPILRQERQQTAYVQIKVHERWTTT
jgi:hypothetical protein